jgi:hypothetical protein
VTKSKTKKPRAKKAAPVTDERVLVLRLCRADMTSQNGFRWPESGAVEAKDWKPTKECGNGLHGWLWGEGDHCSCNYFDGGKWLVVSVLASECIDLGGKVKFPRGEVVHCGDQASATAFIKAHPAAKDRKIIGGTASAGDLGTASAGDRGTASAGYRGTASAGDRGTASAGYRGTASAGDRGTASAGYRGTASAGDLGTASAGDLGTASAGDRGTASAGYRGTASAGDLGTASAGYRGTASAGYRGTASAGDLGTASAGEEGAIVIRYWSEVDKRWRLAVGYTGENGIENGKRYHVRDGKLVEGEHEETKQAREYAEKLSKMKPAERE